MPTPTLARAPGSRLTDWDTRCARCRMPAARCLCALLPRLETRTRVVVVMHVFEAWKTTNTGILATRCLENSCVVLTGQRDTPAPSAIVDDPSRAFVLYPDDDALPLDALPREGPLTLVVPDGNWRQARKQTTRVAALRGLPRVRLSDGVATRYRLRTSTTSTRLATMEAIAYALSELEGAHAGDALLRVFDEMVARTLAARGARM